MNSNDQTENRITVVGLCGSLRPGSYTRMAVQRALWAAQELGAQTRLIDLAEYQLVFCDGVTNGRSAPSDVLKLRREIRRAQGVILGTPDYHGSFSGVLKNALDLLSSDDLKDKMVGLVSVSGGALGGIDALNGLRAICRSLHAWVIPQQAAIPEAWKVFDETGKLKDSHLEERLREVGHQVARFAQLHSCADRLDSPVPATPRSTAADAVTMSPTSMA
jgi:FMN reductase